jgi:hypothetical protein
MGIAGLAIVGLVAPAAGERGGGRMAAGDIAADCEDAAMNTPRDGSGDVKLTADVVDGATVAPGDEIRFRLTWDPARWSGAEVDRALACVRVKGLLEPDLSAEEGPTANDGVFEYRLRIPDNIRPDCDVCVEGFLTGLSDGGNQQQLRSERHCFMSGPPGPPTPPATNPPAPPVTGPPTPETPTPETPTPETTATTAPARIPTEEVPTEVGGITASNPSDPGSGAPPAALPATADPAAELPRTGSAAGRAGAVGGGMFLALGGLAVMGGAGRSKRRLTPV